LRLPRDITGNQLIKLLTKFGYQSTRQSGSHVRLTTSVKGIHHITIPLHDPLKVGILHSILNEVCNHFDIDKDTLLKDL
jgi:predicted RNA binding protein YcfA (HicA-like mRNA interferase family)